MPDASHVVDAGGSCDVWSGLEAHAADAAPATCGLLWYMHIGKTGGDTVKKHLMLQARPSNWTFYDLYMAQWPPSLHVPYRWLWSRSSLALLAELNKTEPRAIVHQHDGISGVGEYMLDRWLKPLACRFRREGRGCRVMLTTTLREPIRRTISHAAWVGVDVGNHKAFESFAKENSNLQTKFPLFAADWRVKELRGGNEKYEASLLPAALSALSLFDLIGRTEELEAFCDAIDAMMGWPRRTGALGVAHDSSLIHFRNGTTLVKNDSAHNPSQTVHHLARVNTRIDAQLYGSFCHAAGPSSSGRAPRTVPALCDSQVTMPHYWAPLTEKCAAVRTLCSWSIAFNGSSCHSYWVDGGSQPTVCEASPSSTLANFESGPGPHRG